MRAEMLKELMAKVDECAADPAAKAEFKRLIQNVGAAHNVKALELDARVLFARKLLDMKVPRAAIRDRLMASYGIKESQAYRDIDSALQVVPKSPEKWDADAV
jgi:hypothetical protein